MMKANDGMIRFYLPGNDKKHNCNFRDFYFETTPENFNKIILDVKLDFPKYPIASICGLVDGKITKEDLTNTEAISVLSDSIYCVSSYSMSVYSNSILKKKSVVGGQVKNAMGDMIQTISDGDLFIFDNIIVKDSRGNSECANPIVLEISSESSRQEEITPYTKSTLEYTWEENPLGSDTDYYVSNGIFDYSYNLQMVRQIPRTENDVQKVILSELMNVKSYDCISIYSDVKTEYSNDGHWCYYPVRVRDLAKKTGNFIILHNIIDKITGAKFTPIVIIVGRENKSY